MEGGKNRETVRDREGREGERERGRGREWERGIKERNPEIGMEVTTYERTGGKM